jgi:hypothetical protein
MAAATAIETSIDEVTDLLGLFQLGVGRKGGLKPPPGFCASWHKTQRIASLGFQEMRSNPLIALKC